MLPILFQNNDLTIYSYPLLMGLGWGVAYQIFFEYLPKEITKIKGLTLFWGIFLFSWIGAKLLFYQTLPSEIKSGMVYETSFWTGGGFVFYGGLIGAGFYLLIYKALGQRLDMNLLWPMVPALTIGHAIGRLGCLLAGCCYGDVTDWWWGIESHGVDRHPTQLIEALSLGLMGIYTLTSKQSKKALITFYLLGYGILRFSLEYLRGDEIRGHWGPFTPSQWISLFLVIIGISIIIIKKNQSFEVNPSE